MDFHFLTGSYADKGEQAIEWWQFDKAAGYLTHVGGISGIDRPSFLAVHPDKHRFVACSEVAGGELVAYELDKEHSAIRERNRRSANGDHPAHVCFDETGEWVIAVNYSGGNVNLYPFLPDGTLGELADSVQHEGTGPVASRQDAAHPHSVFQIPATDRFLVSDLGLDKIIEYKLDSGAGRLIAVNETEAPPGSGPRHLAFHHDQPFVYSLEELSSTLSVYEWQEDNGLVHRQRVSLVPERFDGENTSAEVMVSEDDQLLYATNRGHDSVAVFGIRGDGLLELKEITSAGGKGPRHFALVPGSPWLITANEESNCLAVLHLENGVPYAVQSMARTQSPVCIKAIRLAVNKEATPAPVDTIEFD